MKKEAADSHEKEPAALIIGYRDASDACCCNPLVDAGDNAEESHTGCADGKGYLGVDIALEPDSHFQQRPDSLRLPWKRRTAVSYSFSTWLCLPLRKQKYTGDLLWHDYA